MGLFEQAARELRGYRLEQFSPQSTAYWVAKLFGGGFQTSSGLSVTPDVAMQIGTVYASCRNLAEDLARMPLPVYRDNATTAGTSMSAAISAPKVIDRKTPAYAVLNRMANPEMTAMSFRETMHGHVALRGDGFAEIERDQALRLKALWPLNPGRMRMARNGAPGVSIEDAPLHQIVFIYTLPNGQEKIFAPEMIFHPRGFGSDGLRGYSIVSLAREAMGLALATEAYGGRFFANDATPGVVLTHPATLSDKARTNIEASWKEAHQGLDNAHRMAILEEGLSVAKVGINPVDAEFLATRKFQRDEIPMWFRMPPDKIGNYERATFTNMEQSDINYVRYTLGSHATRFEQQLLADNVVDADHFALHDFIELLRGDSVARAAYYHSLRMDGVLSGEDIRLAENFGPSGQPAASEILIPLNTIPASAFRPDGMTVLQLAKAAYDMARAGYLPDSINQFLGLGDLAHTGFVPGVQTPDPGEANSAAPDESRAFLDDEVGRRLLAILESRTNGHHPELEVPVGSV